MALQHSFFDELIVDNFAGGGGASIGIELATGKVVDIAINHDPAAIAMHKANHPYTKHYCESVWDISPLTVTGGKPVALAWFSPDCKHFSKAKGGKPVDKNIRGLAWVAVRWAATVHPRVIILENVEEFKTWCPIKDGYPDINQKGRTFNSFVNALKAQGYVVEWRELKACDYGAPTIRKRFFLIARCDGNPIVWPEPTHGNGKLPYKTAADIIDWSIPCKSIFERKKPLAENTMKRIAKGIMKFVIENPNPFIVQVNHSGEGFRGQDINTPLHTVTAKHGYGIVTPTLMVNNTNNLGGKLDEPLKTITTGNHHYLVSPVITQIGQTGFSAERSYSTEQPLTTIVSKNEHCLVSPTLIQVGYGEAPGQAPRVPGLNKPLGTVVSGGGKFALTCAFLSKYYGGTYEGSGSDLQEPVHTITSKDHNAIVTAFISRQFNTSIGHKMDVPLGTVTSIDKSRLVMAFLIKYYGQGIGQDITKPLDTVVSKDRFGLVTIQGIDYRIVDIGMRMLEPHELFAAQGFPLDYIIDRDCNGKAYPKNAQVARCGNAVCPPLSEALVRANLPELCGKKIETMEQLEKVVNM